jgi:type VI protein secretion system component Hcp
MAEKQLDAFLELMPKSSMSVRALGESLDYQQNAATTYGGIAINSFKLNSSGVGALGKSGDKSEEVTPEQRKKLAEMVKWMETQKAAKNAEKNPGAKEDRNFAFEITKDIDSSSPILYRAYCSNSYMPKRPQFNAFEQAMVTFRKTGAHEDMPVVYLMMMFRDVYVSTYKFKADGAGAPEETIEFKALGCSMTYAPQASDGTMNVQPIERGWDLKLYQTVSS